MRFGFHPLTDLYGPNRILEEVVAAEKFGFGEIYFADHFHPWSVAEGTTFAWTIIASAAERTRNAKLGTAVTCPLARYNPAIVAQAFSTLAATYEGRIFLGVGSGEALNEVPVGLKWPKIKERLEMLEEAIQIIRNLWTGNYVTFEGKYYSLKNANLFTKPRKPIPLYVSAFGPKAAEIAGRLGDGWITGNLPEEYIRDTLLPAVHRGVKKRKENHQADKFEMIAELIFSYDEDYERAVEACRPFAAALSPMAVKTDLTDPRELKAIGDRVERKTLGEAMLATDNFEKIVSTLERFQKLGFDCVEIASLSLDNEKFMKLFKDKVVPLF